MNLSTFGFLERVVLNKVHHVKNKDEKIINSLSNAQFLTFIQLLKQDYIVEENSRYVLSVGGEKLRQELNKRHFKELYPNIMSTIAIIISLIALFVSISTAIQ